MALLNRFLEICRGNNVTQLAGGGSGDAPESFKRMLEVTVHPRPECAAGNVQGFARRRLG